MVPTLGNGEPVWGVTLLAGELYLLRDKEHDEVEVYDIATYSLQRSITLPPKIRGYGDMTSCEHYRCVYIGDHADECVHRLDVQGSITLTRWVVNDRPTGLSVNTQHLVIVACRRAHKIKQYSTHGDFLWELPQSDKVVSPQHAIQTHSGQFIVCHGGPDDAVNRVCMISADGHDIVHSHGRWRGLRTNQYDVPTRLAVDSDESVFVVDFNNRRVTLLSPTLKYVRQVVSRDQLKGEPVRLCLDIQQRHLYIAVNECNREQDMYTAGRVMMFSV